MNKILLSIKTDKSVKEEAQKIAKILGLPLSTIINAYLKEFVREKSVRISLEPQIRPEVENFLAKASRDYKNKKNISKKFVSSLEAIKYLRS
jgi:addiction module RelB/DinJ family antitoxin